MQLNMYEQSGFILESKAGFKLAVDIGSYTPLEKLENLSVDALLISHMHQDHFSIPQIKKINARKVLLNQECIDLLVEEEISLPIDAVKAGDYLDIGGIKVKIFDVDHGPNVSIMPKENFGFLFDVDGKSVYFAGDMFFPSGIDVSNLEVDFALIPVGTYYTFGPQEALVFAKQFKKINLVLPIHYTKRPETKMQFSQIAKPDFQVV